MKLSNYYFVLCFAVTIFIPRIRFYLTLSRSGRGKGEGLRTRGGAAFINSLLVLTLFTPRIGAAAESPYKIRIGFPSLAFSYLPYYVAQEKGFLKKYGLDSEYIQMRTGIQPQAVVNGNINYLTSVSNGISAAVAGLPLVIVINFCDTSPWVLVTQKNINKPQDFVGKTVALSGIRTSPYYFFQAFLKKFEINEKEVGSVYTGGTSDSFLALTTNRVVGTVLTPPFDDKAVSLGYKKFMQLGDLADIPYVGLVTSQAEIKNNRESVRRTIAAIFDAIAWLRANRAESAKMIVDKFKVNQTEAENTYATLMSILNKDGRLNPKLARGYLDILRQEKPIPADYDPMKLTDFSLLPAAK
ncbi:MAG TPA: ABC transporter substrate-binding protein [Candidatus Binatia bacterium]|nr:ABC transporter substrate-binding protein [Candidatus Binatia bacterium]